MRQIPEAIFDAIESIQLPSIPQVLLRFLSMVEDDRASMKELASLVGQDPALSARFLTVANSPALRRDTEIKSLDHCMVVLGTRLARTLATCLAIQNVFARTSGKAQYDIAGFWGHSLRVAELARAFAAKMSCIDLEEAFLSGLLHNVGQLLLLGGVGERYGDLLRLRIDEAVLCDVEGPVLGTDHAVVGAWLVDQWKLSSFMSDAILFHHKPVEEIIDADVLSRIIWASQIVSSHNEKIYLAHNDQRPDLAAVESLLGLDLIEIETIRGRSFENVALLAAALGVAEAADPKTLPSPFIPFENIRPMVNEAHSQMEAVVRDMALMQSLQQNMSDLCNEAEILLAVRESARILFGLGRIAFLLLQPDKPALTGANFDGQPMLLQRLEIGLDHGHSLAAAAALGKKACSTFDGERPAEVSLVDVQIARALDSEGLLYVPMCTREGDVGVMVYGLSAAQFARIRRHLGWMTNFARLAAVSLESWREKRDKEQKIEADLTNRFEQQARKVAHEAGNPLGIIKNYLKIVNRKLSDENDVSLELDILREEIDRVSHILLRLRDMTEASPTTDSLDINCVIEGMLALYGETLFSSCGITLEKSLDLNLPPVRGDRDSVKQILLNLWKNGAEAMPNGGRFVISTHDNVILNARAHIEIRLRDSGPGMPADVMQRLFQPLDTNRRPGHSGIGLSITAALVERLGGQISCKSDAGAGTSFSILLPRSKGDGE
ncbi:MAG: HDOD domain-containing protein [Deltaproteobacteria bacterium]|nr:HDOD domain-containing protein [Deltaproteobacteria bacterium]